MSPENSESGNWSKIKYFPQIEKLRPIKGVDVKDVAIVVGGAVIFAVAGVLLAREFARGNGLETDKPEVNPAVDELIPKRHFWEKIHFPDFNFRQPRDKD